MKKIKIVSVGSGWVVSNRHIPALYHNKKFEITAVVGRREEKLQKLCDKYDIPRYYTGEANNNPEWLNNCDAVMIGTDPFSHYKLVKYCLEHGKHVLVEKPFTTSLQDSEELVALAEKLNLKLGIVHNFQFSRSSKNLDQDLKNNKLGKIKGIYAFQFGNIRRRLPVWYEKLPWGLFFDESPHLLYLLDKYGEGLQLVNAFKINSTTGLNTPALVTATFQTKIGVPASLYLNFEAPVSEWYVTVIGDKSLGIIDVFRDIYFSVPNDNSHKPFDILNTSKSAIFGHLKGTFTSGLKVINKNYLCGNETIVNLFANAVLNDQPLMQISSARALAINKLQFEVINNSK